SLFADSKGYIWVGTEKGLNRFDPNTNTFLNVSVPDYQGRGYTSDYIYSICETPDGSIWATTNRGLNRITFINAQTYHLECYQYSTPLPSGLSLDDFIYKVRPSKKYANTLWLGTKAGLKKVTYSPSDLKYLQFESYRANPGDPEGLSHNVISDIWEEENGNIWIATYNGLNLFNPETKKFQRFTSQPNVPNSLSNNWVYELFEDHSGILWIGTGKGINKLNLRSKPFHSIRLEGGTHATNSIVTAICQGNQANQLWVGTNGGLNKLDFTGSNNQVKHYTLVPEKLKDFANFTTSVISDSDGWIWVSTQGAGVMRIRASDIPAKGGKLTQLEQFTKGQLNDDYVIYMHDVKSERLWLGLWDGGIDLYNKKTGTIHHFPIADDINLTSFPNVNIIEVNENGKTVLWVGTRGNGLLKLNYDAYHNKLHLERHYRYKAGQKNTLSNDKINSLFWDSQQRLWIATGDGLDMLMPKTNDFQHFTKKDGLPDNTIQTTLDDAQGNIWVSTANGIACLQWINGRVQIRSYDVLDGLQDNYFYNNSGTRLSSGLVSFGGVEGLNIFAPEQIHLDATPPMTALSDFRLFNKSVPIGKMNNNRTILDKHISEVDHIILNHRENVLSFEFASLHFAEPKKNKFAYKLEGFDPDWVYTDAEKRYAHYTNLPYRDFTFYVKSANGDGIWSEPISLKITVKPPFWLTWWAFAIYAALFIALLYAVWWVTHMRAAFRNRLALERVEREKLEELNQLKLQFFTNISHELRTPLTLIISPLEQLVKEKSNDRSLLRVLSMMYQNAGKLLTMINQLLDFRKSEAGLLKIRAEKTNLTFFLRDIILSFKTFANEHHIDLIFNSNNEEIVAWIDRDQMEKAMFNLLSNAFKFTPDGGKVEVNLLESLEKEQIIIRVADSGQGIAPEQLDKIFAPFHQGNNQPQQAIFAGTGIGLALVKT
ncbi:MAG: two-component regulator propeller domain-containing protein, partial [Saprospiraceae bacterium]